MRMYQVDAFTDRLFSGNPAAVLIVEDWLPDDLMLAIAAENNLAETAFAKAHSSGTWDLRWFAPRGEVDFCGHATLATAHVLCSTDQTLSELVFHTRVGTLRVTTESGGYVLDVPAPAPEIIPALPDEIAGGVNNQAVCLFRNFENYFVDLGSAKAVRVFEPDLAAIARLGPMGLVVTGEGAKDDDADFVSRYFAPGVGIPEDPVTGSIHATLVPYWSERLGRKSLLAHQASARGGWIRCQLSEGRVYLRGNAVTYMEATIALPAAPIVRDR